MNGKKNDHIRVRNQKVVDRIRKFVGEDGNICGCLDEVVQLVSKKLKLIELKKGRKR